MHICSLYLRIKFKEIMPRPQKNRNVNTPPTIKEFKPIGVPRKALHETFLSLDEYEAIRLADYLGYPHDKASDEMNISRPTFTRLIEKARKKISTFLIEGSALIIEGGNIHFSNNVIHCLDCGFKSNIKINKIIKYCPQCNSDNLKNFAKHYGHGKCCRKN